MIAVTATAATPCTAFEGQSLLRAGPLIELALAVKAASGPVLVFDDATGRVVDLDLRGSDAEIVARLAPAESGEPAEPRGRGRPKLGVVGREVTLLPRHWEWLAAQPGGASVALRRLVDEARRAGGAAQRRRAAREAGYRVMSAMAGDLPGFEEASRALFAGDRARFEQETAAWPADLRAYVTRLAFAATDLED
ncbi:hypothetical protein BWR60_15625 [Inquilinus limosus]|uniref:DUF2239 domain-containing protein n=1 Tax=Inquilinus limosus TaxID=171674 RepID=A0A211ZLN1_9PROT|nr:hypothetical protein BWR60_15625 [Inquilinus limosus]